MSLTSMTGTKNNQPPKADQTKSICLFLTDYASWLYGCGATCTRITKNVDRLAKVWKLNIEMTILPNSIHLAHFDPVTGQSRVYLKKTPNTGISFYKNTQLSKLSWAVTDGQIQFEEAQTEFARIISAPYTNKWVVLILASLANMSFCRLFGGDFLAMIVVFVATLLGFRLKQVLLEEHVDVKLVFMVCAFFSAVIGTAGYVFGLGDKPDVALATSVLYLIPGIPYINSLSDLIQGQYLVSFSRFMNSMILTFCLSVGLAGGILLMNLKMF
ncbi:membrane protein [Hoylesella buccalis DNF00853]|uniref:Membrane protein n=2 Tax=Hoylesella buccalis TaxID=28127 RepID=A0A096BT95_9BACT|nr:membrane protein [Hoylesella buccalis DNF00853]